VNYSPEQFFRVSEAIEAQGGVHIDAMCKARRYEFSGERGKPVQLPGCGNMSLFEIPYEGEDGYPSPVTLCAVCDDVGLQPRFISALRSA
jgi:hypothetical protein